MNYKETIDYIRKTFSKFSKENIAKEYDFLPDRLKDEKYVQVLRDVSLFRIEGYKYSCIAKLKDALYLTEELIDSTESSIKSYIKHEVEIATIEMEKVHSYLRYQKLNENDDSPTLLSDAELATNFSYSLRDISFTVDVSHMSMSSVELSSAFSDEVSTIKANMQYKIYLVRDYNSSDLYETESEIESKLILRPKLSGFVKEIVQLFNQYIDLLPAYLDKAQKLFEEDCAEKEKLLETKVLLSTPTAIFENKPIDIHL